MRRPTGRMVLISCVLAAVVLGGFLAARAYVNRLVSQDRGFEILGPGSQVELGPGARLEVPEGFVALVEEYEPRMGPLVGSIDLCREPDYASPLLTVDRLEDVSAVRRVVGFYGNENRL